MDEIVVGFDGSEPAMRAVRWAAAEAALRKDPLRVIQSWRERWIGGPSLAEAWIDPDAETQAARAELDAFVGAVRREHPDLEITADILGSRPAEELVRAADDAHAALLVVGSRGRGGFASLLLGSTSRRVAADARCPVIVVRGTTWSNGPIVVGVDGSDASRSALVWAAHHADRHERPLHAVLAWTDLVPVGAHGPEPLRAGYTSLDAERALRAIVEETLDGHPWAGLDLQVTAARPAAALLDAAEEASLLVVGATDRGAIGDLGSVTWQVLHHAPCTVAVVHAETPSEPPGH